MEDRRRGYSLEDAGMDECLRYTVDAEGLLGWNGHLPLPLSM